MSIDTRDENGVLKDFDKYFTAIYPRERKQLLDCFRRFYEDTHGNLKRIVRNHHSSKKDFFQMQNEYQNFVKGQLGFLRSKFQIESKSPMQQAETLGQAMGRMMIILEYVISGRQDILTVGLSEIVSRLAVSIGFFMSQIPLETKKNFWVHTMSDVEGLIRKLGNRNNNDQKEALLNIVKKLHDVSN